MSFDWKSVVGTVAPGIATALGGPLAGMAVSTLAKALGVEATEEAVANVVATNDPNILLKMKEADLNFKQAMREADIDLERIHASDRNSARTMASNTSISPQLVLSAIYTIAFAFTLYAVFNGSAVIPADMREPAMYLLGILSAGQIQIMNFWFGSSSGSKEKTMALANSKPA
jgi:hypothetical protein